MPQHFKTFDALRFFSFLLVFVHHLPLPESPLTLLTKSGAIGVSFFFVLSGFLITYILLHEKMRRGSIYLPGFYARRILRIWPLYYAMVLFAFTATWLTDYLHLPVADDGYKPDWLISCLFLENYKMMWTGSHPNISPLTVMWTLCIEEHFYLLWSIAICFLPDRKFPYLVIASILAANIVRPVYASFNIASLDIFSNIDYFAWGAIPAWLYLNKEIVLEKVDSCNNALKVVIMLLTAGLVFVWPNFVPAWPAWLDLLGPTIFGLLFSLLILFTLTRKNAIVIGDNNLLSRLGKYTYGLYLYHTIIINIMMYATRKNYLQLNAWLFTLVTLAITITVSLISYHLFEKHFLRLRKNFYPPSNSLLQTP